MSARTATDYHGLTPLGKMRRLGRLAATALERYPVESGRLRLHCFATNLLYRVRADIGERFVLRLAYPGWRTLADLQAEAAWLDALQRDTDIGAPAVVRAADGEAVLPISRSGVPHTWHATLMTWVPGTSLAHHLDDLNLERLGELFARLHRHGKAWKPPPGFSQRRFEAFLSRGEPDVIFGDDALGRLRDDDRRAFLWARERVEREYAALDRGDLRVIHCDLWHENVKLDRGRLRPFDFEDTVWGYRLHDIAMGMLDLLETVGAERYPGLVRAFRRGYQRLLDWPAGELGVLQLGRLLWLANWTARFAPASLATRCEGYGRTFRGFERTGELRLP